MTRLGTRLRALVAVALLAASTSASSAPDPTQIAVPRAHCGPGSLPETGLQGQVPLADRKSARSTQGYRCNITLVGQYQGQGSTWVSASTGACSYHSQAFPSSLAGPHPGVQVVDVRDPRHPRLAKTLTSPAFKASTWESLKVNDRRHLLGGVWGGVIVGTAFFDLYDVSDCLHPRLLNSISNTDLGLPAQLEGHEGAFSPDGNTYWVTGGVAGVITAVDVKDPRQPRVLWSGFLGVVNHGFSFSPDGRLLYLSTIQPEGLEVYDVSSVQDRQSLPQPKELGALTWADGGNGQMSVPITYAGRRYLLFVDEQNSGGARMIDVQDPTRPRIVSRLKLEIQLAAHASEAAADLQGTGFFGYEGHYCTVDRAADPTLAACAFFQSGVRLFDIRDPRRPREVGYYNPPAQTGRAAALPGSEHAQGDVGGGPGGQAVSLTADWCSSPPRFVGRDELWVTCQDNGFMVLRFTRR
jgi:hypothetical protein